MVNLKLITSIITFNTYDLNSLIKTKILRWMKKPRRNTLYKYKKTNRLKFERWKKTDYSKTKRKLKWLYQHQNK